jgi:DNA-directed RNA polymerase subunit N (RpoN/RPB10)
MIWRKAGPASSRVESQEVKMSYAWENLSQAMRTLASCGTQRERLLRAYTSYLTRLTSKDVPAEIREQLDRLTIEIRCCSIKEGHSLKHISDGVGDNEVEAMIDSVIRMYDAVARYQPLPAASRVRQQDWADAA